MYVWIGAPFSRTVTVMVSVPMTAELQPMVNSQLHVGKSLQSNDLCELSEAFLRLNRLDQVIKKEHERGTTSNYSLCRGSLGVAII
jgi:hypothetical protein